MNLPNPFDPTYDNAENLQLIAQIENGSHKALEQLARRHQHYISNIALKFVLTPYDAEDITQV